MPLCGLTTVGCSVMVAAKFFDDIYYDNAYYAKVRVNELHALSFITWLLKVLCVPTGAVLTRSCRCRWEAYQLRR